jgi:hypothetical protein
VLDLPGRIHNLLLDAEIETLGALMMTLSLGEDAFLNIKGLGEKALQVVQEHLANFDGWDDERNRTAVNPPNQCLPKKRKRA